MGFMMADTLTERCTHSDTTILHCVGGGEREEGWCRHSGQWEDGQDTVQKQKKGMSK